MNRLVAVLALFLALALPTLAAGHEAKAFVTPGGKLKVLLQENGGTGYEWLLASAKSGRAVKFKDSQIVRFAPSIPGSPQFRVFEFTGVGEGAQTLNFELRRSWEHGAPAEAFAVQVQGAKRTSATEVTPLVYWVRPLTRFGLELPANAKGFSWKAPKPSNAAAVDVTGRQGNLVLLQARSRGTADLVVDEVPTSGKAAEAPRTVFATVLVAP